MLCESPSHIIDTAQEKIDAGEITEDLVISLVLLNFMFSGWDRSFNENLIRSISREDVSQTARRLTAMARQHANDHHIIDTIEHFTSHPQSVQHLLNTVNSNMIRLYKEAGVQMYRDN